MAATQTPPSPPEPTTEPNLDRSPAARYESRSSGELLDIIDDLEGSRLSARVREAIWISLILHLIFFWWFFYGPRPHFMESAKVVNPMVLTPKKQDQMTYLEMPKDLQQQKPKPTNIISNQNHRAQTKHPTPEPKTIQQLEAMRRAGVPAPPAQQRQPQRPPQPRPQPQVQPQPATPPRPAQPRAEAHTTPPPPPSHQGAESLPSAPSASAQAQKQPAERPSPARPAIAASHPNMSVGEIIRQAERQAAHSHGQGGDFGQNAPIAHPGEQAAVEVLSDTRGVDFGPYLQHVVDATRRSWYLLIPEAARAPLLKQGKVAIQFRILPDGNIQKMQLVLPSGDVSLDRAAWGGITGAGPFPPLPKAFKGPYLALRFYFLYNENTGQWERQ